MKALALSGLKKGGLVNDIFEEHEGTHILQSLDGFAISLNADGRFLYISETVSIYLGLSQVKEKKIVGLSVFIWLGFAVVQVMGEGGEERVAL